jgi:Family of unknown function (DUF6494)
LTANRSTCKNSIPRGKFLCIAPAALEQKEYFMDEETLNLSLRNFLKMVGVRSQREIEQPVAAALASGAIAGTETLAASMTLEVVGLQLKGHAGWRHRPAIAMRCCLKMCGSDYSGGIGASASGGRQPARSSGSMQGVKYPLESWKPTFKFPDCRRSTFD